MWTALLLSGDSTILTANQCAVKIHWLGALLPMPNVEELEKERVSKFEAICALIADELGLGELHTLGEPDRALVKAEADEATERWMEHADMATRPKTSLQKLLAEHFELVGLILDMQESEE